MPVFTQHNMSVTGNVVDIYANSGSAYRLNVQPGSYVEVPETPLQVRKGLVSLTVGSLDEDNRETRIEEPEGDVIFYNCVPIRIDVFRIGNDAPVASTTTRSGPVRGAHPNEPPTNYQRRLVVDAGPVDETHRYSRSQWKIRFTNETDKVAEVIWFLRYIRDSSLVSKSRIPISVVNNAFAIVLNALAPEATLRGGLLTVQLSPEMAEYFDSLPSDGALEVDLSDQLSPAEAHADLMKLQVRVVPGADALREVDRIWAERDALLRVGGSLGSAARAANDAWRETWHDRIDATDVAVQFDVAFTDIEVTLSSLWLDPIPLGEIADASAKIFLVFKSHTAFSEQRFGKGHALVITPAKVEGVLLTIADIFGKVPDLGAKIEEYLNKVIPTIHRYFAEAVLRMVHNQYTKRFIDCQFRADHLEVVFCDDPADPGAFPVSEEPPPREGGIDVGTFHRRGAEGLGPLDTRDAGDLPPPNPVGVVPDWFALGSGTALAQLDKVDTIIVVMMENRSFDHMLGRLSRKWPDRGYICYPDDASNSVPGHSPLKMVPARNIQQGATYYAIRVDPYHGTDHVLAQINDGRMDGFARDIMTKPNPRERIPQIPLTYYDETDLPFVYDTLAAHYLVCDQWFAAHPGGTYPNRWACLSGRMPELKNFPPDDTRMGFIQFPTIFDLLAPYTDVEWIYYEANLGMLRMYDRYRLDTMRVLPLQDEGGNGFLDRAKAGTLPPVVFIEPRITGIPPLEQASDDHPPANLLRGQEFLADVYQALVNPNRTDPPTPCAQWEKCMLVITYDEHGGFFDHVPPPDGFPKIHPQGQTFLGVRVPTFIVSPLVPPGSVSHTVFDHTSILKTILTRHRAKFRATDFGLFGERVPKINHLGEALNAPVPPPVAEDPTRVPRTAQNFGDVVAPSVTLSALPAEVRAGVDDAPYAFSLARAMMPKR